MLVWKTGRVYIDILELITDGYLSLILRTTQHWTLDLHCLTRGIYQELVNFQNDSRPTCYQFACPNKARG